MRAAAAAVLAVLVCAGSTAAQDTIPPAPVEDFNCGLDPGFESFESLATLPRPFVDFMATQVDAMADRGEFYNVTDAVVREAPFARFIRAGHRGHIWFIWWEEGGITTNRQILIAGERGGVFEKKAHEYYFAFRHDDPCRITHNLLRGRDFASWAR